MRRTIIAAVVICVCAIGLGAVSVYPFTKLLVPWIVFSQWYRALGSYPDDLECLSVASANQIAFRKISMREEYLRSGCLVDTPLLVFASGLPLTNSAFSPAKNYATMSCPFALQLRSFVQSVVIPEAKIAFGAVPKRLLHKGAFACRGQRTFGAIMSSHAYGEAIDLDGIELEDGKVITVTKDYRAPTKEGQFLRMVAEKGCKHFGTVLGPGYDEAHEDHLHFAVGFPRRCVY